MKLVYTVLLSILIGNLFAGANLWHKIANRNLTIPGERKIIPQLATLVQLDDAAFRAFQFAIPKEESGQYTILSLPMPDGSFRDFKVFERVTMEKELADKYPTIKTYQAIALDDAFVTAKLDYTEFGFHAMVFSKEGVFFIDPYTNKNTGYYNSYYKKDYTRPTQNYSVCMTPNKEESNANNSSNNLVGPSNTGDIVDLVTDGKIRTFRLALACTIEYSAAVGGPTPTKATVLSAIVTTMNRVNGVCEKDLSIHMNLVAKEDTLIFITSDSYTNDDGGAMLGQNTTVCNARIGTANYDIGHVFSTGGGGVAGLGVVCTSDKAEGVTGSSNPIGDGFDIDYVIHEMGHQYGANHTFNGSTGSCAGNRNSSTAYEPGSGITIMAYAGICDNNDIAPHSDDFFHRASIVEIFNYIKTTSCGVLTNSNNTTPIVNSYVATYSIPYKTSFEITASGADADGDPIKYCWEEWDLGPAGNWNAANNTTAPIFRSFVPNYSGTRVFPIWDSLIKNQIKYRGEVLPEVTRDVKFRCTVRDIHNGYGAFNAPDVNLLVKSVNTTALFRVTSFPNASTFDGNTLQTITWDVANTDITPIFCANVNILLSLDSARTFPYTLAGNTANDGSEQVLIPDVVTANASARIKVKGSGNIFFDLNNGWLKINQGVAASFIANDTAVCSGGSLTFTNTSTGSPDSVRWTINGGTPGTSNSNSSIVATFNTVGNYNVSLIAYKSGNASVAFSKMITVKPIPTIVFSPLDPVICLGDSIEITANYNPSATCMWSTGSPNTTITVSPTTDTYYSVVVTNDGCSATDSVLVTVNPSKSLDIEQTICEGESVTIGAQTFTTTGTHIVVLQTSLGCDSTIKLELTVDPVKTTNLSETICEGETATAGGQTFTTNGIHTVVLQTSLGCDSIINLTLTVNPVKITNLSVSICEGESFTIGAQTFTTDGDHSVVLQTSLGCDSTVNLDLTVNALPAKPVLMIRNDSLVATGSIAGEYGWYLNGFFQTTTNIPAYKPTQQGSWTVVAVSSDDCLSEVSDPLVITGIRNNHYDVLFSITPNPNNGQFEMQITSDKNEKFVFVLYNLTGQEMMKEEISVQRGLNSKRFSINNLSKGMYFISLTGDDGVATKNIIVQ